MYDCTNFSKNELALILDLASGMTSIEIAEKHGTSDRWIQYRLSSIRQKSYSTTNAGAVAFALLFGYIKLEDAKTAYQEWQNHLLEQGVI